MSTGPVGPRGHFSTASNDYLRSVLAGNSPGSENYETAKALLEDRKLRRQAVAAESQAQAAKFMCEAAAEQATAAKSLTRVTGRLVVATWALVVATLFAATILGGITWEVGIAGLNPSRIGSAAGGS